MGKFFNLCIKRVCELSKFTCKCDPMSCFNNGFFYLKKKNKSVTSGPGLEKSTVQSSGTCRFCYWAGNFSLSLGQRASCLPTKYQKSKLAQGKQNFRAACPNASLKSNFSSPGTV